MSNFLLVIVGPTASGKTAAAIEIAQMYEGEIVCADSRTVYRGMDLGTAKPTTEEQELVPHHLLDVVEPDEAFTVADFKELANQAIEDVQRRNKLPIMVGGSGLYVDAVIFDYGFSDSEAARNPINPRHLSLDTPRPRSGLRPNTVVVGINPDLEILKQRVKDRVDAMVKDGFMDEAKKLFTSYGTDVKALHAPGYKAFKDYFENKISLDEAKAQFVRNDYLLARRQRTWFKRNKSIHWFDNREELVDFVTTILNKKQ